MYLLSPSTDTIIDIVVKHASYILNEISIVYFLAPILYLLQQLDYACVQFTQQKIKNNYWGTIEQ